VLPVAGCARGDGEEAADLVLRNGRIVTVDDALPEAQAVAIRGHTIIAVGSDAEIGRYVGRRTRSSTSAGAWPSPASSRDTAISWASARRS
jgi:predicted amidohydrolase YtcJ